MTQICPWCGKEFTAKYRRKYCSVNCKYESERKVSDRKHNTRVGNIVHNKVFDLKVGDIIIAPDKNLDDKPRKFVVTAIYPHLFTCKRLDNGMERSFTKSSQIIGEVKRA